MKFRYLDQAPSAEQMFGGLVRGVSEPIIRGVEERLTRDYAKDMGRAALQGLTLGFGDEIGAFLGSLGGAEYEALRDKIRADMDRFRDEKTAEAYFAEIGSSLLAPGGLAKLLGGGAKTVIGAGGLSGALAGAGYAEEAEDIPASAIVGGAIGAGGSAIAPAIPAAQQALRAAGVRLTPGQLYGGALKTTEEALTSLPIMGAGIKQAQRKAIEQTPAFLYNRALKDIGVTIPVTMSPRAASNRAREEIRKAYENVFSGARIKLDNEALDAVQSAITTSRKRLGKEQQAAGEDLEQLVIDRLAKAADKNDTISASALKDIQSKLGSDAAAAIRANNFARAEAIDEVDAALLDIFAKQFPEKAGQLNKLDRAYSKYVPLRRAASMADESAFTPAQALRAVRAEERRLGATGLGRLEAGEARMQRPAEMLKRTMGGQLPESGTVPRLLSSMALMGAGGVGGMPFGMTEAGAMGALGLGLAGRGLYTRPGREALSRLLVPAAGGIMRAPATAGLLSQQIAEPAQELLLGPTYP
jgi:hypothetical protein